MERAHCSPFFFFNDTATTEIYTLSLHDALPISVLGDLVAVGREGVHDTVADREHLAVVGLDEPLLLGERHAAHVPDRKSTRLNSSHGYISYAVFCLKKKTVPNGYLCTHG